MLEGIEISKEDENLARKCLNGEISFNEAKKLIIDKYVNAED